MITLIYYTANRIPDKFAENVRDEIFVMANGKPIISISQKPLDFGKNICVGDIGYKVSNVYRQILIGAKEADTDYVACCEDDTLYVSEHFDFFPEEDAFYYNENRWNLNPTEYYYRMNRFNMSVCVAPTKLMIKTLEERFEKFGGTHPRHSGEPGRHEKSMGLTPVKMRKFRTDNPVIQINHRISLGSVRKKKFVSDKFVEYLPYWHSASDLWRNVMDGR